MGHWLTGVIDAIGDIQMTDAGPYQMAIFNPASLLPSERKPINLKYLSAEYFNRVYGEIISLTTVME